MVLAVGSVESHHIAQRPAVISSYRISNFDASYLLICSFHNLEMIRDLRSDVVPGRLEICLLPKMIPSPIQLLILPCEISTLNLKSRSRPNTLTKLTRQSLLIRGLQLIQRDGSDGHVIAYWRIVARIEFTRGY